VNLCTDKIQTGETYFMVLSINKRISKRKKRIIGHSPSDIFFSENGEAKFNNNGEVSATPSQNIF